MAFLQGTRVHNCSLHTECSALLAWRGRRGRGRCSAPAFLRDAFMLGFKVINDRLHIRPLRSRTLVVCIDNDATRAQAVTSHRSFSTQAVLKLGYYFTQDKNIVELI